MEALLHRWPEQDRPRICAIAAHSLRHDGAPARDWQPWLALAAWAWLLRENIALARSLALLARVYPALATQMPESASTPNRVDLHALTHVLGLSPADDPPPKPDADRLALIKEGFDSLAQDDCFGLLADAIVRRDWELCRTSFDQLAAFALEGRTADAWDAELNPGYEPVPAALAAVASQVGFRLDRLAEPTQDWLWPAIESELGIVPAYWPFATA